MAKYKVLPIKSLSPYLNTKRIDKQKEIFKFSVSILEKLKLKKNINLVDICCANGEFLFF